MRSLLVTMLVAVPFAVPPVSEHEIDVTASEPGFSIVSVRNWTEQLLTKRRAVDFCRVAAALCRMA